MFFHSKIDWQKIKYELSLLKNNEGYSIGPLLLAINCYINGDPHSNHFFKKLYRFCFQVEEKCKNLNEEERHRSLNDFVFDELKFQIIPESMNTNVFDFLPQSLLSGRRGPAITLALFYIQLAEFLELPIYLTNHKSFCVLKWIRPKKSFFIDLSRNGTLLEENEVLNLFNKKEPIPSSQVDLLAKLPGQEIVTLYLERVLTFLTPLSFYKKTILLYDILLELHPSNTDYICQRALTKKALGLHKEALLDFKRYFTYIDKKDAPKDIKLAFYESCALADQGLSLIH